MTFFKVQKNNNVVDVGCVFLKWNSKRHKLFICEVDEGQFVQSYKDRIYKASWLKPAPAEAKEYELAEVVVITETEYNDIKALLDEDETVPVEEEPVYEEPVVEEPQTQEEKPLTIAQMREIITEQQKQIEVLMEKVMT